ncbi:MAG TPA: FAD-dependent oxidoreductase [Dehalococcoidia bacterium]|nr:FAD-dependent oxidoreductase [Dehalococcoidia bacterium]
MSGKKRLVIIGNGMTGGRFVEEIISRGGADRFDIVMFGDEQHGNYNRILLSSVLAGSHSPDDIFINSLAWYEENGIKLYSGVRAGWIDRISKSVYAPGGITEPYDKLVIATGSSAYVPPMDGLYDEEGTFKQGVFVFRSLDDCQRMTRHASTAGKAVVIGGGLLGLEAARGLLGRGLEVHVVHLGTHLMDPQLDQDSGGMLNRAMEALGVNIHLGKLTTTVLGRGHVTGVGFRDGGGLDCDMVVLAAGIRPNIDLAKQAGLQVQQGIVIKDDLSCRNDRDVNAIGECAQHRGRLYGTVAPLWEQAAVLAERLTERNPDASYRGSRVSTKLKVMGIELAVMGDKEPLSENDEEVHYSEPRRGVYKKLIIREGRLAGAILLGDGLATPGVLQSFDRGEELPKNRSELLFPRTGGARVIDVADLPVTAQICNCNGVSKGRIAEAVQSGQNTLQAVCEATRAGSGCGTCKSQVQAVFEHALGGGVGGPTSQSVPRPLEPVLIGQN